MLKRNKKNALILAFFVLPFVLSACGNTKKKTDVSTQSQTKNGAEMVNEQSETREQLVPSDKMEFSDPGDDEIGKEIKEMDDLLNQTTPSEYSEDDLTDAVIENDVELK
ncbi:hypothetical protein HN784_04145 [bacterium]|nr:hypothetical protein [bacterium]MBT4251183.1 hypothetical protein [bacterium]MBT4598025.1 hypothetical protein [bacterium]MBT6753563.1 hypothetical protein [bacterium]MBT7037678.1 hypothetical protein [bacterium]